MPLGNGRQHPQAHAGPSPHGRIVARYSHVRAEKTLRRVNFGRLEIEVTVDDPKVYTKPWTVKMSQMLQPDTELIDFICAEKEDNTWMPPSRRL
jgi:hypothetical protein